MSRNSPETLVWERKLGIRRRRWFGDPGSQVTIATSAHRGSGTTEIEGVRIEFALQGPPGRYSRAYYRQTQRLTEDLHRQSQFDLVHAQEFSARYLRPPAGLPLISTIHGTLDSETPLARPIFDKGALAQRLLWLWQFKHRLALRGRYRRFLRAHRHLIVDSEFTREELRRDGVGDEPGPTGPRVHLAPLGVDEALFTPLPRDEARRRLGLERPYLLTVSRLTWSKGLHIGIEAAARAQAPIDYVILGDGPERRRLERQAAKHPGLRVRFVRDVAHEQLPLYYAGSELVLMPELTQPAFGLVALEANLTATPVLA